MSIVALTTDFGAESTYVAQMKGVLLSRVPDVRLVDLNHSLPAHDIRAAELFLRSTAFALPLGTVHLVVIDPGVGTSRLPIAIEARGMKFVGPDNGVLGRIARIEGARSVCLDRAELFVSPVSPTFHGRDLFAPVAAELVAGAALYDVGSEYEDVASSEIPEARLEEETWVGEILGADRFGNLTTNIPCEVNRIYRVSVSEQVVRWVETYGQAEDDELLALRGSDGFLEIARRERAAGIPVSTVIKAERVA